MTYEKSVSEARLQPFITESGQILLYDMYIGTEWYGSRRTLAQAQQAMSFILEDIRNGGGFAREYSPKSVSQNTKEEKHDVGAF